MNRVIGKGRGLSLIWQRICTLFSGIPPVGSFIPNDKARPHPLPVVALVVNDRDRSVLANAAAGQEWDVHFAESFDQASAVAKRLAARVILLDRDWPAVQWREAVESLAAPQQASVILVSGVSDTYLWQELVRRAGYEILPKPLRMEDVQRVVKLALSYWGIRSAARSASRRVLPVTDLTTTNPRS